MFKKLQKSRVYKVWTKKPGHVQKLAINKNPQFLSNPYETWWKWLSNEAIIFTKFHEDWTKIMDFLPMANFWECLVFFTQSLQSALSKEECQPLFTKFHENGTKMEDFLLMAKFLACLGFFHSDFI